MAKKESAWICAMKTILTILLAAALAFGGAVGGWFAHKDNWFKLAEKTEKAEETKDEVPKSEEDPAPEAERNGGLKLADSEENGISLAYAAPIATGAKFPEGAETITATVRPDNDADNTAVTWSAAWKNPASEWAAEKEVEDYLTLTPKGDSVQDSKTVTAACMQPFGEQILITVTVTAMPEISAVITADYARKVESVSLSFGDVACDFDSGRTGVTVELSPDGTPKGGAMKCVVNYGEIYTLTEQVTTVYDLVPGTHFFFGGPLVGGSSIQSGMFAFCHQLNTPDKPHEIIPYNGFTTFHAYNFREKGLYFGIKWFADNLDLHFFESDMQGWYRPESDNGYTRPLNIYDVFGAEQLAYRYDNLGKYSVTSPGTEKDMFTLTITIYGEHTNFNAKTTFYMDGYTNNAAVEDVETDTPSVVY